MSEHSHTQIEQAFILHKRRYRETSLLVDFFCAEMGRFSAVVRGAVGSSRRPITQAQHFVPLSFNCRGKQALKTVTDLEIIGPGYLLTGTRLYCGLYVNELLVVLLTRQLGFPALFSAYIRCLTQLAQGDDIEITLRCFELRLLSELGYGLVLNVDAETTQINPTCTYVYAPESGFNRLHNQQVAATKCFLGADLLAIHAGCFDDSATRKAAKRLLRQAIDWQLSGKKLKSRSLFTSCREREMPYE